MVFSPLTLNMIQTYCTEGKYPVKTLQNILHTFMIGLGDNLEAITREFICIFADIGMIWLFDIVFRNKTIFTGIPTVKVSQSHRIANLQNQTIVATLFAGVATGMIQVFTGNSNSSEKLHDWTVLLWYMTLILSVASAVNGLLGLSWTQAV